MTRAKGKAKEKESMVMKFDSPSFSKGAEAWLLTQPQVQNDLPTISLLLFLDYVGGNYRWYRLREGESILDVVGHAMQLAQHMVPIGACVLLFETHTDGRIYLATTPTHIDGHFDPIEVIKGTVPYFMQEEFGYTPGQIESVS